MAQAEIKRQLGASAAAIGGFLLTGRFGVSLFGEDRHGDPPLFVPAVALVVGAVAYYVARRLLNDERAAERDADV